MRTTLAALLVVGPALAVPGAGAQFERRPSTRDAPARAEARIIRQVRHQLLMLPYYSVFDNLEFSVQQYQVTLYGQVVWPTLRSDAAAALKGIEGVEKIENRIEVLPLSPFDDRIRRAEYRAIYRYPLFERYAIQPNPPIHIIVKNGDVTLVGVVANPMDRNVAGIRANGVAGVFSVKNQLKVEKD